MTSLTAYTPTHVQDRLLNKRLPSFPTHTTMLLLETFKVRIFLKIENRWLAYVQMRYQLESTKTIHRRWDHLLFGRWLVTLRGQSSAEHGDRSIIFHGRGTIRLANLVKKLRLGYVIMVQYAANLKIRSCHFSFRNCSTLISLSKLLVVPSFTSYSNRKSVAKRSMSLPLFAKFSIHIVSSIPFIDASWVVYTLRRCSPQELESKLSIKKFNRNKFY